VPWRSPPLPHNRKGRPGKAAFYDFRHTEGGAVRAPLPPAAGL